MPNCMEKNKISQIYPFKPSAKINENDQIFGDTGCQTDRDHQDHTAFGIDIDQHLRFEKG